MKGDGFNFGLTGRPHISLLHSEYTCSICNLGARFPIFLAQMRRGDEAHFISKTQFSQCTGKDMFSFAGRKIAFGIKNSKESQAAFVWACANIVQPSDILYLVHIYERNILSKEGGLSEANELVEEYENRCHLMRLKCHSVIMTGSPLVQFPESARTLSADLVVLGSKRRSNLMRAFLGCTASDIAQQCPCPVLIIKVPKVMTFLFIIFRAQSTLCTESKLY